MSLFTSKKEIFGLDLGSSAIKVVELKPKLRATPTLVTYGSLSLPSGLLQSDSPKAHKEIAEGISEITKKAKVTTKNVVTALPGSAVFTTVIELPSMSDDEVAEAIRWEAKAYVPSPLEEVSLDFKILERKKDKLEVLIIAAPLTLVEKYTEILNLAGLNPVALEIEPIALIRSLIKADSSCLVILDIGKLSTEISIVDNTIIRLTRNVPIGGNLYTKAIAKVLKIDEEKAESIKRESGINPGQYGENLKKTLNIITEGLIYEINRTLNFYSSKKRQEVSKIISAGGSANIIGLNEYLTNSLKLEVKIGNPWTDIDYPAILAPTLEEIGPIFAIAVGLALREMS